MDLRVSIDGLYDEIAGKAQKIIPFRMLQRSFTSDIGVNVEDEIYEFISLIKQAVNLVQDDSYKKRLKSIFNKYSLDIDNILKDDSKINDGNYQKLVLKLREELHPFLIELNSYAKANELGENMNLFEQFKVSLDLIRGKLFVEEIRNCDKLPVVSFVADIIDKLDGVVQIARLRNVDKRQTGIGRIRTRGDRRNRGHRSRRRRRGGRLGRRGARCRQIRNVRRDIGLGRLHRDGNFNGDRAVQRGNIKFLCFQLVFTFKHLLLALDQLLQGDS